MIPRYFMVIWIITFMGDCFPDGVRFYLMRTFLDVDKDADDMSESPIKRQLAGLMYLCEDSITANIMKLMDDDVEDLAYNIFVFEKINIVYAMGFRTCVQDFPQLIL